MTPNGENAEPTARRRTERAQQGEIARVLRLFHPPGEVFEIRILKARVNGRAITIAGYFDDPTAAAEAVLKYDGKCDGIYHTMNGLHRGLIARAPNRLVQSPEATTADRDVTERNWVLFDFDAVRPKGISSTQQELDLVKEAARNCCRWLKEQGLADAIAATSGNGYHVVLCVNLRNDEAGTQLVKRLLQAVAQQFNTDCVTVDTSVYNASRIARLYGTTAAKGTSTEDRPHRRSQLIRVPSVIELVPRELLEKLASKVQSEPKRKGNGKAAAEVASAVDNQRQWLTNHGQEIVSEGPYQDSYKFVLKECPFKPEHKEAAVFVGTDGTPGFNCFHVSDTDKHYSDLRRLLDGEHSPEAAADADGLTEERLAQEFEAKYKGCLHYDHDLGCWFIWDEQCGCWRRNKTRRAYYYAREICCELNVENAKEFARARVYGGVEQIAQNSPTFAVTHEHWDRDPWLLSTPGGTIDFRTGEMRAAEKTDYMTKQTAVSPDSNPAMPLFTKFLKETTQDDDEVQRYLQRLAGYSLTGLTREQKIFFFYGPGGNGKSVLVNTWAAIAGDYHVTAAMDCFIEHHGERHPTDLAMLTGARLVTASETHKGRHWNEALINRLTGGDPVSARFMRRDFFSYVPQFTLIFVGNYAPELDSVNEAARRRFRIIPFTFQPKEVDEKLFEELRPEWPAILSWMITGAREWYENGLGATPTVVADETADYFEEQNRLKAWIDECCELGDGKSDTSASLFRSWEQWCKRNGEDPGKSKSLVSALKKQFHCKPRPDRRTARGLIGIAVKVEYKADPRTGERDE